MRVFANVGLVLRAGNVLQADTCAAGSSIAQYVIM